MPERVAIVGSRTYPRLGNVRSYVSSLAGDTTVISGGARGVDQAAEEEAKRLGLKLEVYPADWTIGRGAGYARNQTIALACDRMVAFWDGMSRGTEHVVGCAFKLKKPVIVFGPEGGVVDGPATD